MNVRKAIKVFQNSRPPGIENECVKDELIRRYDTLYLLKRISKIAGFN